MTKILCNYNDATVKCLDMFTSGMVGAQISFEFAEEWEGLTKTAVFSAGDVQRDVLIVDSNVITIPWEVLQHAKEQLIVGVYGTNGTELVIPTVYAGLGRIKTGADPSGDPGIPPTPSILDQVLTAASESLANAQRSEEKADEAEASAKAAAESEANVQAMFDRMGDIPVVSATEFDADAETVIHRSSLVNLKTGATDTEEAPLPVANTQQAGVMTAETVQAIMDLTAAVSTLSGQNIRLSYTAGATPTAAEIQSFVISKGYTDQTRWEYIAVVVKADNHVWRYYTGTGWQDDGIDTVSVATEYIMGVVLGSSTDGKVYVEADGTMSVNGYDAIISTLENLSTGKADDNAVYHEWRLGYNATAQTITKDGAAVPFADVYSAVEDKTKFVYVEWANRVYIPQYVSSGLIYFMCAYIDSGLIKLERIMFDAATGKALTGSLSTYDKAKIDELLRAKANSSEVYTKTEIDAKETELKETLNTKQDKLIAGSGITIAADGKTISATGGLFPTIIVAAPTGTIVTATKGSKTITAVEDSGVWTIKVPEFGVWSIKGTLGTIEKIIDVDVDVVKQFNITLTMYSVWGVQIDQSNSNPETSVTYIDDAVGMTPASDEWDVLFNYKPCLFINGAVSKYLNPNNYAQDVDGNAVDITTVGNDVMVEFPKMGYNISTQEDIVTIRVTNDPDNPDFCYKAFSRNAIGDRDYFYYGAYKCYSTNNMLYSSSGKTPTGNKTRATYRNEARARGTGYFQNGWYQLVLLQCLYLLKYKNLNSQEALGNGHVGGSSTRTTGATNSRGLNYGSTTSSTDRVKLFGIEDFWGNIWQFVEGCTTDGSRNIIITDLPVNFDDDTSGIAHTSYSSGLESNMSGYLTKVQGTTDCGFIVKKADGSSSTYYSDSASLWDSSVIMFGGRWGVGADAGAFCLYVEYDASGSHVRIASRLMFV